MPGPALRQYPSISVEGLKKNRKNNSHDSWFMVCTWGVYTRSRSIAPLTMRFGLHKLNKNIQDPNYFKVGDKKTS